MKIDSHSRIIVVGTTGCGKSILAQKISHLSGLSDIELDELFWGPNWSPVPHETFRGRIQRATLGKSGWVMHGNNSNVRDLTWDKATTIVWLDYSLPIIFWRVLKRSIFRVVTRQKIAGGNVSTFKRTFLSKNSIILRAIQTYDLRKRQFGKLLTSSEVGHLKVVILKNPRSAQRLLAESCVR